MLALKLASKFNFLFISTAFVIMVGTKSGIPTLRAWIIIFWYIALSSCQIFQISWLSELSHLYWYNFAFLHMLPNLFRITFNIIYYCSTNTINLSNASHSTHFFECFIISIFLFKPKTTHFTFQPFLNWLLKIIRTLSYTNTFTQATELSGLGFWGTVNEGGSV